MYDQTARYYDLIHDRLTADVGFLRRLAAETGGPLLELGCGTGRLLVPLARDGHRITGVDNSTAMLDRARQRLAAEPPEIRRLVHLVAGDFTTDLPPIDEETFKLAFCGYNTLMHAPETAAASALRRARRSLAVGGQLFLDLANPIALSQTADEGALTLEQVIQDDVAGETVLVMTAYRQATAEQALDVTWIYDAAPSGGGAIRRLVTGARFHYYYPHQIELLLEQTGFQLEALFGDYDRASFAEDSERLLILALAI